MIRMRSPKWYAEHPEALTQKRCPKCSRVAGLVYCQCGFIGCLWCYKFHYKAWQVERINKRK